MDVPDAMVPDDGLDEKGAPYLPREVSRRDATAAEGAAIVVVVVVVALGPEVRCVPKDAMSSLAVSAALLSLQHRSFLLKGRGSGGGKRRQRPRLCFRLPAAPTMAVAGAKVFHKIYLYFET